MSLQFCFAACAPDAGPEERAEVDIQQREANLELALSIPDSPLDEDPVFHGIVGVAPGPDGTEIYVIDGFRKSVRVFDWEGSLLREFGSRGGLPELDRPSRLSVRADGVFVVDMASATGNATRGVSWFDHSGAFREHVSSPSHEREDGSFQRHFPQALVRHDQLVANYARGQTWQYVLLDGANEIVAELTSYPSGGGSMRWVGRQGTAGPLQSVRTFGTGGTVGIGGDSLVVFVDAYRGVIDWHEVEPGGVALVQRRDLGWVPEAVRDPDEVRRHEARAREADVDDIEVVLPEFESRLRGIGVVASSGDVWLERREMPNDTSSTAATHIVVPFDAHEDPWEITLPESFELLTVDGDLLFGRHRDPDLGVQIVRVHRITG